MLAPYLKFIPLAGSLLSLCYTTFGDDVHQEGAVYIASNDEKDWLPREIRDYWMREAIGTLGSLLASPCPFGAFGTVVVNHTRHDKLGDLVCIGANNISIGNPTLHGELAAINNCSAVLTDPNGQWGLTGAQASKAFSDLTLYTTAEPCPMCAAAIRWAGFSECVFGTSMPTLVDQGWSQIQLRTQQVFEQSRGINAGTQLFGAVLANETDPYFAWQFRPDHTCPDGCQRSHNSTGICLPSAEDEGESKLRSEL